MDLAEVARPHLLALAEATGETSTLSIPGGDIAVTVEFVQSPATVHSVVRLGRPSVTYATATGKIYLAYGRIIPAEPPEAFTSRTITDPDHLRREFDEIRGRGWAQARGEREAKLHTVAVLILDARGPRVAVLGAQGQAGRFDGAAASSSARPASPPP